MHTHMHTLGHTQQEKGINCGYLQARGVMLSKRRQCQQATYCITAFICHSGNGRGIKSDDWLRRNSNGRALTTRSYTEKIWGSSWNCTVVSCRGGCMNLRRH